MLLPDAASGVSRRQAGMGVQISRRALWPAVRARLFPGHDLERELSQSGSEGEEGPNPRDQHDFGLVQLAAQYGSLPPHREVRGGLFLQGRRIAQAVTPSGVARRKPRGHDPRLATLPGGAGMDRSEYHEGRGADFRSG